MNDKGFTLVEVLAMLVVLGILMGVTIPNITGIVNNHKNNIIKTDAQKMANTAKMKIAKDKIPKPEIGKCIVFSMNYLNIDDNFDKGPNDGDYLLFDSFVIYKREGNRLKYYVRIVEEVPGGNIGIELEDIETINQDENNTTIQNISTNLDLTGDKTEDLTKLNNSPLIQNICSDITAYYPGKASM